MGKGDVTATGDAHRARDPCRGKWHHDAKQGCLIIVNLVAAFALGMAPWPKASTHREEIKRTDWILRT